MSQKLEDDLTRWTFQSLKRDLPTLESKAFQAYHIFLKEIQSKLLEWSHCKDMSEYSLKTIRISFLFGRSSQGTIQNIIWSFSRHLIQMLKKAKKTQSAEFLFKLDRNTMYQYWMDALKSQEFPSDIDTAMDELMQTCQEMQEKFGDSVQGQVIVSKFQSIAQEFKKLLPYFNQGVFIPFAEMIAFILFLFHFIENIIPIMDFVEKTIKELKMPGTFFFRAIIKIMKIPLKKGTGINMAVNEAYKETYQEEIKSLSKEKKRLKKLEKEARGLEKRMNKQFDEKDFEKMKENMAEQTEIQNRIKNLNKTLNQAQLFRDVAVVLFIGKLKHQNNSPVTEFEKTLQSFYASLYQFVEMPENDEKALETLMANFASEIEKLPTSLEVESSSEEP